LQEIPVVLQFHPVDLRPRLDEPLLCLWQASSQALNRVDSEDGRVVLVVGVEMRSMVRRASFDETSGSLSRRIATVPARTYVTSSALCWRADVQGIRRGALDFVGAAGCIPC
jgi:hypothetical protein